MTPPGEMSVRVDATRVPVVVGFVGRVHAIVVDPADTTVAEMRERLEKALSDFYAAATKGEE